MAISNSSRPGGDRRKYARAVRRASSARVGDAAGAKRAQRARSAVADRHRRRVRADVQHGDLTGIGQPRAHRRDLDGAGVDEAGKAGDHVDLVTHGLDLWPSYGLWMRSMQASRLRTGVAQSNAGGAAAKR